MSPIPGSETAIILPGFHLQDIQFPGNETRKLLRSNLLSMRAVRLRVPGSAAIQDASLALGKRFFLRDEIEKCCVDGKAIFYTRHGERVVNFDTLQGEQKVLVSNYIGSERGWIRRGTSPSKADKEYFQWGGLSGACPHGIAILKDNIWPNDNEFIKAKKALLELHTTVHLALLSCISSDQKSRNIYLWSDPFEIICRDTHYFNKVEKDLEIVQSHKASPTIINPPHPDLSNGTLISHAEGLQIYIGPEVAGEKITRDELNWHALDWTNAHPDDLLYIIGLATEIQTCGLFRASWHRVVSSPGNIAERFSTVSFCNAGIDDLLPGGPDIRNSCRKYPAVSRTVLPVIGSAGYLSCLNTF